MRWPCPSPGACRPEGEQSLATLLGRLPLFRGLSAEATGAIAALSTIIEVPRHTLLFGEGAPANALHVVLSGQIKVFSLTPDGRESIVEVFSPPSFFGVAAVLGDGRFPVHAEALYDATVIRVPREAMLDALSSQPLAALRTVGALARCRMALAAQIHQLETLSPLQRVAEFILALPGADAGAVTVRLPFNKETLAGRLGIRRESLSRVLARLKPLGVAVKGYDVSILDVAALRRAVRPGCGRVCAAAT
ncbi:MAG: Crp/Fnr family transcriptional regulator [Alphaproteobacteria bacterium]|nr:Crp/Fnr family transcriptional regulator [Alphaproteobacteria bacterium]